MLNSLVVGLGRAGAGLHLPVLSRLRSSGAPRSPFADGPVVVCDPVRRPPESGPASAYVSSLAKARELVDPNATVTHLCTPPVDRERVIERLAMLGFRRIVVEKPLATDEVGLERILKLRERRGLDLVVVTHWLEAELTRRMTEITHGGEFSTLRGITVRQHKPRFLRSQRTNGHPTAFDVEIPHSLGVVLRLAGPAELADASCSDLRCGDTVIPRLGGARLLLRHPSGVRTDITSDLASPFRERSIALRFDRGTVTGHYPLAEDDDHAQLVLVRDGVRERSVFRDDALAAFLLAAYRYFDGRGPRPGAGPAENANAVRLLCAAKRQCDLPMPADVVPHAG